MMVTRAMPGRAVKVQVGNGEGEVLAVGVGVGETINGSAVAAGVEEGDITGVSLLRADDTVSARGITTS